MKLRRATNADLSLLGQLNRELIQDEGSSNSMSVPDLCDRMASWLAADYEAVLFERSSGSVAYALYRHNEGCIHLRQFFVCRPFRRQGLGREAFQLLCQEILTTGQPLVLEVLSHNAVAIEFWRSVGLREHALTFRLDP